MHRKWCRYMTTTMNECADLVGKAQFVSEIVFLACDPHLLVILNCHTRVKVDVASGACEVHVPQVQNQLFSYSKCCVTSDHRSLFHNLT